MFQDTKFILDLDKRVRTPFGYQRIESVHKTHPVEALEIIHENGAIKVAKFHTFVINNKEYHAFELAKNDFLETPEGTSRILEIKEIGVIELYDITLDQSDRGDRGDRGDNDTPNYWYYSDGVLSHNSGKSITVSCYLAWLYNFHKDMNVGIVANRASQAREFLNNVKNIYTRLPIWMMQGTVVWNKSGIENELGMRILTDVPSQDSFRGFTINCLVVDECAFIKTSVWEEFADSIFPSQSALAWKKNIIISTAKGLNHFHTIVQKAKAAELDPNSTTVLVEVKWDEVPRFDSKGNIIPPAKFKEQIIKKHGAVYFEQNYGNSFVGSSETLVNPDILDALTYKEPIDIVNNMLRIYEEPVEDHIYLMGVDAAKSGKDYFAIQVLDITQMPIRQAASAQLQVNYLQMPEYLYEWGTFYNSCMIVVENNEGAGQSVADQLFNMWEYPNLYYQGKKFDYPGFRTTTKSREQIIRLLESLINSNQLELVDQATIHELQRFELVDNKYQASSGHDDLVMSCAVALAPLSNLDNFKDFKGFLNTLKTQQSQSTDVFLDIENIMFEDF